MRRLEADGDEFKLAPVFKITARRTLVIGRSKDHFDLWEADKDHADPGKLYEELLTKVMRKFDRSAKGKMQHGDGPLDIGTL